MLQWHSGEFSATVNCFGRWWCAVLSFAVVWLASLRSPSPSPWVACVMELVDVDGTSEASTRLPGGRNRRPVRKGKQLVEDKLEDQGLEQRMHQHVEDRVRQLMQELRMELRENVDVRVQKCLVQLEAPQLLGRVDGIEGSTVAMAGKMDTMMAGTGHHA